jgi:lipopolysaccharide export system permease protein
MKLFPGKTFFFFLIKEFLKVFFIALIFILGLSFIIRTLEGISSDKGYTLVQIAVMRVLEAPFIISREALLASSMFASVYTISSLTKNKEVLALRSCGVSVYRIVSPIIFLGFVLAVGSLLFEDYVVVPSIIMKDRYSAIIQGNKPKELYRDRHNLIVFGEHDIIYKIDTYHYKSMEMAGILIIAKDTGGKVSMRIDAERAQWDGKRWVFYSGIKRSFKENGEIENQQEFSELRSNIKDDPVYFGKSTRKFENMTLKEQYQTIEMMRKMGFDYKKPLVKFHRKLSNPLTILIIIIIGVALGSMPFQNALVISFSLTILIVLCFLFFIEIGYTFGSTGKIPPVMGGWLGNIVFVPLCVYLLRRKRV